MPDVTNERESEATNDPQRKTELEARNQEKSNHITGKFARFRSPQPQPWTAAMEATVFTGWIYDHLQAHAAALKVAHPFMLRAIAAAKRRDDPVNATQICACV